MANDLETRMVFIGGPRQVGKTTFALTFLPKPSESQPAYLNWDDISIRPLLLKGELPSKEKCIVIDEIHKFARWRNLIKGFYDTNKSEISFISQARQGWIITEKAGILYREDTITIVCTRFPLQN